MQEKEFKGLIYKIINPFNDKIYIGQTVTSLQVRINRHQHSCNKGPGPYDLLHKDMVEKGVSNFKFIVIDESAKNEDELDKLEIKYIKDLKTQRPNGYNISPGGNRSKWADPEATKKKLGDISRGKKQPREIVERRLAKIRGNNHWTKKKGPNRNSIEAMRKANLEREYSPELARKSRERMLARPFTKEELEKSLEIRRKRSKINAIIVKVMRKLYYQENINCKELSEIFPVSQRYALRIVKKEGWKHVE